MGRGGPARLLDAVLVEQAVEGLAVDAADPAREAVVSRPHARDDEKAQNSRLPASRVTWMSAGVSVPLWGDDDALRGCAYTGKHSGGLDSPMARIAHRVSSEEAPS